LHTVCPNSAPYLPGAQFTHFPCPVLLLYCPLGQGLHELAPAKEHRLKTHLNTVHLQLALTTMQYTFHSRQMHTRERRCSFGTDVTLRKIAVLRKPSFSTRLTHGFSSAPTQKRKAHWSNDIEYGCVTAATFTGRHKAHNTQTYTTAANGYSRIELPRKARSAGAHLFERCGRTSSAVGKTNTRVTGLARYTISAALSTEITFFTVDTSTVHSVTRVERVLRTGAAELQLRVVKVALKMERRRCGVTR
jgi:hypothetical protein